MLDKTEARILDIFRGDVEQRCDGFAGIPLT